MRLASRMPIAFVAAWLAAALMPSIALGAPASALAVHDVDTARYPQVGITVSMPGLTDDSHPRFSVAENGEAIRDVTVEPASTTLPVRVVLVLDTSGSMQGRPWEGAVQAAESFLGTLEPNTPVSVIAFADHPVMLSDFTVRRATTMRAVRSQQPARETALYDAIVSASRSFGEPAEERRVIVLLSDGGDTVSASTFAASMKALERADATLYAVSLASPEADFRALKVLAGRSGGRMVSTSNADELAGLFRTIAAEIAGTYRLVYRSGMPATKDVDVDVVARASASKAIARTSYPNPAYLVPADGPAVSMPAPGDDLLRLIGTGGLAFMAAALLGAAVLGSVLRERSMLSHVRYYDQSERRRGWRGTLGSFAGLRGHWTRFVHTVLADRGWLPKVSEAVEAAGLPRTPAGYVADYVAIAVVAVLVLQLLLGSVVLSLIGVGAACLLPKALLDASANKRRARFETQLPDVLSMLSTSLRGGWTLERAIELCAHEAPEPARKEFGRVVAEMELGLTPVAALENMAGRVKSVDFDTAVSGISVQREVGGNLAEVLDTVADTIREREALRRHVRTLTAEARFSAYILIALPFGIVGLMLVTSPSYIMQLFTTPFGLAVLAIATLMLAVGAVWLYKLTKIEV